MNREVEVKSSRCLEREVFLNGLIEKACPGYPVRAVELLNVFVDYALKDAIVKEKSIVSSLPRLIGLLDHTISKQVSEIIHHKEFQKLEGAWRGVKSLVKQSETGQQLKIKMLSAKKGEIARDFERASEFDQSVMFKRIYESEFGTPGGTPYGVMIGDYEFDHSPKDVEMLRDISLVAAAAFCPFITASSARLFGMSEWSELGHPRDLERIFSTSEYTKWRSLRAREETCFVVMTLPRVLARLPYESSEAMEARFCFNEFHGAEDAKRLNNYCWMNASYTLATQVTQAFSEYGWCTAIRGAEGGGKVTDLPLYHFSTPEGGVGTVCPTEVRLSDRREAEMGRLGLLPLCHYKDTDYGVFFGAQTLHRPSKYDRSEATSNAAISARLPYVMATSRFVHYLKVMGRDKIGSFMEREDCSDWLNRWILNYVNSNASSNKTLKSKYPLADARVYVEEDKDRPGAYQAVVWMRPWLQMEKLTTSMRLVARIPQAAREL